MFKIATIIVGIILSYIIGLLYNKYYFEFKLAKDYKMEKAIIYTFQALFLIVSWIVLRTYYVADMNSVFMYFLFILPLIIEIIEDFVLLKKINKEGKIDDKVKYRRLSFIMLLFLIGLIVGAAFNFCALLDVNILDMNSLKNYLLFSMFLGIVWILGKMGYYWLKE